jgi:hypothetical protein
MALTKFVRNVTDLSDDGGYKFRFCCDTCNDGFESQYVSSSANLLKTAMDVFLTFRPLGGGHSVAGAIDRGLRGKERDAAYERAVGEAMVHFKKCAACGNWVCPEHCWNEPSGMCERCAPAADEAAAKRVAERRLHQAVAQVDAGGEAAPVSCPLCGVQARGGKFCESCGGALAAANCKGCNARVSPSARFCGSCGTAQS